MPCGYQPLSHASWFQFCLWFQFAPDRFSQLSQGYFLAWVIGALRISGLVRESHSTTKESNPTISSPSRSAAKKAVGDRNWWQMLPQESGHLWTEQFFDKRYHHIIKFSAQEVLKEISLEENERVLTAVHQHIQDGSFAHEIHHVVHFMFPCCNFPLQCERWKSCKCWLSASSNAQDFQTGQAVSIPEGQPTPICQSQQQNRSILPTNGDNYLHNLLIFQKLHHHCCAVCQLRTCVVPEKHSLCSFFFFLEKNVG